MTTEFIKHLQELTEQGKISMREKQFKNIIDECEYVARRGENHKIIAGFKLEESIISKLIEKGLKVTEENYSMEVGHKYKISWE